MTTEQAHRVVESAVMLGMISYRNMIKPDDDYIKQREAWRYLQQQGLPRKLLAEWVDAGAVRRHKDPGKAANSAVKYRLTEIQKAICAMRTAEASQ